MFFSDCSLRFPVHVFCFYLLTCVHVYSGQTPQATVAAPAAKPVAATKSSQPPSDAIQKAMEATLAVIELPPPAVATTSAAPVAAPTTATATTTATAAPTTGSGTETSPAQISDRFVVE